VKRAASDRAASYITHYNNPTAYLNDAANAIDESNLDTAAIEGTADELIQAGMEDLEYLATEHRELIGIATDEGQDQIANYAQDRVLALEKHIWMYRSTLE
jgi:DNA-binding ferritin-like protein